MVNQRAEFGHWEGDTVEGLGHKDGIHTEAERIYAAQILTPVDTERIDRLFKLREASNKPTNLTIYCYVILQY